MGKVDQGVFTYWLLAHHFGRDAALHRLRRRGQAGARPAARRRPRRPGRRAARATPERWAGRTVNVGGGREVSLSLRETTELCRELTGRDVAVGRRGEDRPGDVRDLPLRLPRAASRSPTGGRGATPRAVLADTLEWIAANERRAWRSATLYHGRVMPTAIVTGSGGLIGSESVAHFVRAGLRRRRASRTTCARASSAPRPRPPARPSGCSTSSPSSARVELDIRDARRRATRCSRATRGELELVIHTAAQPSHDWAASDPHTDFARQRHRHAEPARGRAHARARRDVHLHARRTRSTATARTSCRSMDAGDAARAARGPPLLRRDRHVDVDRRHACTRCSASPRRPPT